MSMSQVIAEQSAHKVEDLMRRLDELWESYLVQLDRYYTAQQQLGELLSSGYIYLAQANFSNPSRIRYGQDYYDQRMKAFRTVHLDVEQEHVKIVRRQRDLPKPPEDSQESEQNVPEPEFQSLNAAKEQDTNTQETKPIEPLKWFGVLVPPALRTAQKAFVQALEEPVPVLVEAARQMRLKEIEIARLRKQIAKARKI